MRAETPTGSNPGMSHHNKGDGIMAIPYITVGVFSGTFALLYFIQTVVGIASVFSKNGRVEKFTTQAFVVRWLIVSALSLISVLSSASALSIGF
jgi:hypothetical protein